MQNKFLYKTKVRIPSGVETTTSVFVCNLFINIFKMENGLSREEYLGEVSDFISKNSEHAGEIFNDLNDRTQECLRYKMVGDFKKEHNFGIVRSKDLSEEMIQIAKCWCCGRILAECLTLLEEDYTYVAKETDPYNFERYEAAGMTFVDSKGRTKVYQCGYSYS